MFRNIYKNTNCQPTQEIKNMNTATQDIVHKLHLYLQDRREHNVSSDEKKRHQCSSCILSEEERSYYKHIVDTCPAFVSHEIEKGLNCPFKDVESDQMLREQLLQIPQSHKKCPAFTSQREELKSNREDRELIQSLFVFRWDLFFDEPLKDFGLCNELRKKTTKKHIEAESVPFIKRFIHLEVCPYQYRIYLANLYKIYEAMEPALEQVSPNHKLLKYIFFPFELNRCSALEKDLRFFYGPNWKNLMTILPSTKPYIDRIKQLAEDPSKHHLLIAHASTRYLGDLYGGQQLMKKARAALKLPEGKGTMFYDFSNIRKTPKYKYSVVQFRNYFEKRMNKIPVTAQECDQIIAEANLVFELNMHVFEDLDKYPNLLESDKLHPMIPGEPNLFYQYRYLFIGILLLITAFVYHIFIH